MGGGRVQKSSKQQDDLDLADALIPFIADPLGYVMFAFPWNTNPDIQQVPLQEPYASRFPGSKWGPDVWACEFLDDIGTQVRANRFDGRNAVKPIKMATCSGHGIGKSALTAWIIKWILDTRPYSKGTVTANTADQLKTKTWSELGKWHKMSITENWFKFNLGRGALNLTHKEHPERWRCDAQTCREENSESFAGQHAISSTSFYIFDEASAVPDAIYIVREGGMTDGGPMIFDFGNPTRNSGRFFEECQGEFKKRFHVRSIDSRTVVITNKDQIQEWLEDYGEDSDFFKVRVRGMFPSAGTLQFIPTDLVEGAMRRETYEDPHAQLVIGVDVARFGDNKSVIFPRVGYDCRSWEAKLYDRADTVQLTGHVVEMVREFKARGLECAGLFIDEGGIGGAVVDQLRSLGYAPIGVNSGSRATDGKTYRYKGDEMWGNMKAAMGKLILPTFKDKIGTELKNNLTQREFGYTQQGNKIHLETKKDMASRGIASPDIGDALGLTFAEEVANKSVNLGLGYNRTVKSEYDVLADNNLGA